MTQNADTRRAADEIDLGDLFRALWQSKVLIMATTVIVTAVAVAYAFLSTPIYRTTVQTLPPTASGLASYNVASQLTGDAIRGTVSDTSAGIAPLSPDAAYKTFLRYLGSSTVRQTFFDEYYLPVQENNETEGDRQRAWKRLNKELDISIPNKPNEVEARLSLEGEQPQTIASWANAYIELASQAASEDLLSGLTGEVKIRHRSLVDQINAVRQVAQEVRQSHITRLKNALAIAESIGLETPADGSPMIAINTQNLNTESVNSGSLLYLRGSKALRSELQQLEQRKNDDAYIAELPNLLKKQALLENINLNPELLSVVTIDRAAIVPEDPVKPNKTLVLLLGIIFGGILGVFLALIRQLAAGPK